MGEAAVSDVGGGPRLPSYSGGNNHRENMSAQRRNNRSKQVFLFLYLKKSFVGEGVRRAHLSWLRGEHSFQKESQAEIHGENLGAKGGAAPSSTSGQSACLGAGWGGETVCKGGKWAVPPGHHEPIGDVTMWLAHIIAPPKQTC